LIPEIASRLRVLKESVELARSGKTYSTRLSRTDVALQHAENLVQYERAGIPTVDPTPSELVTMLKEHRQEVVDTELTAIVRKAKQKASLAATPRTQERALATAVIKVREVSEAAGANEESAAGHVADLESEIHRVKLDGFLEAARKAEFKGNAKKAVDQYQEALFLLRNDDVDDACQAEEMSQIEAKIRELQAS
jgi:hypothetical protein